jgi:hypothetical protein
MWVGRGGRKRDKKWRSLIAQGAIQKICRFREMEVGRALAQFIAQDNATCDRIEEAAQLSLSLRACHRGLKKNETC